MLGLHPKTKEVSMCAWSTKLGCTTELSTLILSLVVSVGIMDAAVSQSVSRAVSQ